jgi:hypothetical protein
MLLAGLELLALKEAAAVRLVKVVEEGPGHPEPWAALQGRRIMGRRNRLAYASRTG